MQLLLGPYSYYLINLWFSKRFPCSVHQPMITTLFPEGPPPPRLYIRFPIGPAFSNLPVNVTAITEETIGFLGEPTEAAFTGCHGAQHAKESL